ncbi:hypothetical protein H6P81_019929 [Aristolochia fimbriata]|uniref:Uncharacterized protein n=1 Tax=Aristolochia fimbriata TaxID=158543 RepID=A0AAV7DUX1_ARIFI|nr:hypothetical protein H6P81_019929 [Aristolochia fimbriata]
MRGVRGRERANVAVSGWNRYLHRITFLELLGFHWLQDFHPETCNFDEDDKDGASHRRWTGRSNLIEPELESKSRFG